MKYSQTINEIRSANLDIINIAEKYDNFRGCKQ